MGVLLVYAGLLLCLLGCVCLVKPLRFLRIMTRRAAAVILLTGIASGFMGAIFPAPLIRVSQPHAHIDEVMPAYHFHEFHSRRIKAPPALIFRAIKEVRPAEIRFLRTLMAIRQLPERLFVKSRLPSLLPGYSVTVFDQKDPGSYEFLVGPGPGEAKRLSGKLTSIEYRLQEGKKSAPGPEILRAYDGAIRKRGGSPISRDGCCRSTFRIGEESLGTWIELASLEDGSSYRLTILAPGPESSANLPMLDLLRHSGFLLLSEEADQELVLGIIDRYWASRDTGERPGVGSPEEFRSFDRPDYVKVAANFIVKDVGGGWSEATTETRIFATDPSARRKFGLYWRIIYPGSSLIRYAWLDAIKRRAERNP